MASLWPWLVVAGAGALHGLNPASGWALCAACGLHSRDGRPALRALLPLALGHLGALTLAAAVVMLGLAVDRLVPQALAGGLLVLVVALRLSGRRLNGKPKRAGAIGLALWSFLMASVHGAGLMLLPALVPLCGDVPARAIAPSASLVLALVAVVVHTAAMLLVTALVASGVCRGLDLAIRRFG
jgi:hypothetical protein